MTIKEIQDEIVEEFSWFDELEESDSPEKMQYIIDLGKSVPLIDDKFKNDDHLIKGCQSDLWLNAELNDDKVIFTASAAAIIPRGIVSILIRMYSNQKPLDILEDNTNDFLRRAGLDNFFQMTRSNGLEQMIKKIKIYALGFSQKK
ncbi:SufE family protein [uncultured Flavobacterium sp.]|uniref:SufE family protein n=1 Tax=uncultured Flavobacterium sp. TaxID=165435 RepID=UPI0025F052DB|nr:SufE family protein [uncultured Flavobacterium sp.]